MKNVLKIVNNNECCGCGTCSVVCKKIKLQKNSQGFCNPQIENSCSSCGNCLAVCPRENTETDYINIVFIKILNENKNMLLLVNVLEKTMKIILCLTTNIFANNSDILIGGVSYLNKHFEKQEDGYNLLISLTGNGKQHLAKIPLRLRNLL